MEPTKSNFSFYLFLVLVLIEPYNKAEARIFARRTHTYSPQSYSTNYQRPQASYSYDYEYADTSTITPLSELSSDATPRKAALAQINQGSTGTCHFNATTGIMEILYAMCTGKRVDMSEPYTLSNAQDVYHGDRANYFGGIFELVGTQKFPGFMLESTNPYRNAYRYGTYGDAKGVGTRVGSANRDKIHRLPFRMKAKPFFFKAHWNMNIDTISNEGRADSEDFDQVVEWFKANNRPVNLHEMVGNIWHSVIMIDYRPAGNGHGEQILVKDSLGGPQNAVGRWRDKSWFLSKVYGAIGVDFDESDSQTVQNCLNRDPINIFAKKDSPERTLKPGSTAFSNFSVPKPKETPVKMFPVTISSDRIASTRSLRTPSSEEESHSPPFPTPSASKIEKQNTESPEIDRLEIASTQIDNPNTTPIRTKVAELDEEEKDQGNPLASNENAEPVTNTTIRTANTRPATNVVRSTNQQWRRRSLFPRRGRILQRGVFFRRWR